MSHLPEREVDTGAPEQQSPHNRTGIAQEKIPMRHTAPRPPVSDGASYRPPPTKL